MRRFRETKYLEGNLSMKKMFLAFLCWFVPVADAANENPGNTAAAPSFEELVQESGMMFEPPLDFHAVEPEASPLFPHEQAVSNADSTLEIRYAVRPLDRIKVDYQDPHSSVPDPNHMFPLMFQSLVTRLSNGGHSPTREYPAEQAEEKFHAHWASASVFDLHPELDNRFSQGLLIAMHKNHLADAYVLYLFSDYQAVKEEINRTMGALAFLP